MNHAKQKIEETKERIESYLLAIKEKSKAISKAQREKFKLQEQILFSQLTLRGSDFELYDKVRENLNNQMEESKNLMRKIDIMRNEHVALLNELEMQKELLKIRIEGYSIKVPQQIIELEAKLEKIREDKVLVVRKQRYEEAAKLRDDEKNIEAELEKAQLDWEADVKKNKERKK